MLNHASQAAPLTLSTIDSCNEGDRCCRLQVYELTFLFGNQIGRHAIEVEGPARREPDEAFDYRQASKRRKQLQTLSVSLSRLGLTERMGTRPLHPLGTLPLFGGLGLS